MRRSLCSISISLTLAFLSACGPSPEEIAAMTAAAWTPTPIPPTATPTPTPVPFDLVVFVSDEFGAPIAAANVILPESGSDQPVQADEQGRVSWSDLPGESVALQISAQGYFSTEQPAALQRGMNEVHATLQRDPFGLLPADACAAGEKLLYIEDFQDGKAQGWQNITAAVEYAAPNNWGVAPLEDGNLAATFSTKTAAEGGDQLQDFSFENAVWRLKARETSAAGTEGFSFLNWKQAPAPGGETRYPVQIGANGVMTALTRLQTPDVGHFEIKTTQHQMKNNVWYFFEVSAYNGLIEVWIDGKQWASYQDPKPLPAGSIGLEVHIFKDADVTFAYDNISVCELSAPFVSIAPAMP